MSTRQQPPPQKTADLSQKEVAELSPAARDQYFDKKAREGVSPDNWLFGPIQQWVAQMQGKSQSDKVGDQNIKASTTGRDVDYVQGLQPSSADYKGVDHAQLKQYLDTNLNVDQVSQVSDAYHSMHQVFDSFSTSMNEAVNKSKGTWEGSAADSAQAYFSSLGKWSDANSQNAKLASETIYEQGQAASTAKNSMPEPIKFAWGDEFKSWATSNPFALADNVDKSLQKQKDSQAAHEQAAGVMSTYDSNLYTAASKQPAFAPPPAFTPSGTSDPNGNGDDTGGGDTHRPNVTVPGGNQQGFSGNTGTAGVPGSTSTVAPGSTTGSGTVPSGGLTPSSFNSGNVPPPSANPNTSTPMGMSPMPMGGMGGPMGGMGGDAEYGGRSGRGGGGGGFGPGSGNTTGAGSASGAARPGGIGAAESAAGRGMGGLGSGSGSGRGGMGGGGMGRGQGAQGEEDAEHQRPTYLVEGDPDEVFGTDMRTAPPVIGE